MPLLATRRPLLGQFNPRAVCLVRRLPFNLRIRTEYPNAHCYLSLSDAWEKSDEWLRYDNEERPHSTIGNIPPARANAPMLQI
ncbi:integrase core domain-containing protein [Fluviibacterium sp. DFM31]|uniref:Integrase core domain-containing protein n=1 Tax=Meridianimarinicoccus marinus TaxID=3231483 RepID=A0ABV3L7U8_9RHOB